ncbi:hypothetical protein BVRB_7g179990 [Beta vulgaris subsp. vulgaris]|uniref:Uncharacterized protein n=1 Tax=Beta vulgaris subsp. vulgaris TaxID=3555 RepID=A0A0J8B7H6_BETVV|nr:hypothetical protein BVRB_7g179990 [Beta vulgaris subsp. vulgaris]
MKRLKPSFTGKSSLIFTPPASKVALSQVIMPKYSSVPSKYNPKTSKPHSTPLQSGRFEADKSSSPASLIFSQATTSHQSLKTPHQLPKVVHQLPNVT